MASFTQFPRLARTGIGLLIVRYVAYPAKSSAGEVVSILALGTESKDVGSIGRDQTTDDAFTL